MTIAFVLLAWIASDAPLVHPIVVLTVDDGHACISEDELSRALTEREQPDDTALDVVVRTEAAANGIGVRAVARALTVEGVDDVVVDLAFAVAPEACQTVTARIARAVDAALAARFEERARAEAAARAALEEEAARRRERETTVDDEGVRAVSEPALEEPGGDEAMWFARPRVAFGLGLGALPIVPDARATAELAVGHQSYPSFVVGVSTTVFAPVAAGERVAVVEPIALSLGVAFDRWFEHVALGARVLGSGGVALAHDASLDVSRTALRPFASVLGGVLLMWRYGPTVEVGIEVPILPLAVVDDASGDVFTFPPAHGFVRVGYAFDFTW